MYIYIYVYYVYIYIYDNVQPGSLPTVLVQRREPPLLRARGVLRKGPAKGSHAATQEVR